MFKGEGNGNYDDGGKSSFVDLTPRRFVCETMRTQSSRHDVGVHTLLLHVHSRGGAISIIIDSFVATH